MTTCANQAERVVAEAASNAWRRPAPISAVEWGEQHCRMDARTSAEPGKWTSKRTPYVKGWLDAFDNPRVRRMVCKKHEQCGGTQAVKVLLGKIIDRVPGPTLWIFPNPKVGEKFIRDRLKPYIEECPAIRQHLRSTSSREIRTDEIHFDRMTLRFAGSDTPRNIESFPYKYVIIDELDRCKPGTYETVRGRSNTFPDSKQILLGTPELESPGEDDPSAPRNIAALFEEGDQQEYFVPCPACGEFHHRVFGQVKWIGGRDAKPFDVARGAWYECPKCEAAIHGHQNAWQLERGMWRPIGKLIVPSGADGRGELVDDPEFPADAKIGAAHGGDTASFWMRGLLNPFQPNPYGYVAAEYVGNGCRYERRWANRRLGEEGTGGGYKIESHELDCLRAEPGTGYKLGRMPDNASGITFITAHADVQQNRIVLEVIGWSECGQTAHLIDYYEIPRTVGDDLIGLHEPLLAEYGRVNRGTGELADLHPIDLAIVDTSAFTPEGYRFCEARQAGGWAGKQVIVGGMPAEVRIGPPVFAAKGDHDSGFGGATASTRPWYWTRPVKDTLGKPVPGSVHLFRFNSAWWKTVLYDAIAAEVAIANPGSKRAPKNLRESGFAMAGTVGTGLGVRRMHFPEDTPKQYFKELVAEQRLTVTKGNPPRTARVWVKRGDRQNHVLDCRTMGLALLDAAKRAPITAAKIAGTSSIANAKGEDPLGRTPQQSQSPETEDRRSRGDGMEEARAVSREAMADWRAMRADG